MKYVIVVSNDDLQMKGKGLVAEYVDKYPLHKSFGNEFTRIYAVESECNLPVGEEVILDQMKNIWHPHKDLEYEEGYIVMRPLRARKDYGKCEVVVHCVERINFPHTDRVTDYDARLRSISELYPEMIVAKVVPDDGPLYDVEPGDTFALYDGQVCGCWTLTTEKKSFTKTRIERVRNNEQQEESSCCEMETNPDDLKCESLEEMTEREKTECSRIPHTHDNSGRLECLPNPYTRDGFEMMQAAKRQKKKEESESIGDTSSPVFDPNTVNMFDGDGGRPVEHGSNPPQVLRDFPGRAQYVREHKEEMKNEKR